MYVIIGIWHGTLQDVHVRVRKPAAIIVRDRLMKACGLSSRDRSDKKPGIHPAECRWNDENEIHIHESRLQ